MTEAELKEEIKARISAERRLKEAELALGVGVTKKQCLHVVPCIYGVILQSAPFSYFYFCFIEYRESAQ